jgi:hypothetical protein
MFEQILRQDIRRYQQQLGEARDERQAMKLRLLLKAAKLRLAWKDAR